MEDLDGVGPIEVGIFFKAGFDGECMGACYQSQRILMLAELKLLYGAMNEFKTVPVNISKPPKEFKELGLHLRVPALFSNRKDKKHFEPIDIADDIVLELEQLYPGGLLKNDLENESEIATRDFFSKFCHWMRGVVKDSSNLETELVRIDSYLATVIEIFPTCDKLFLCGEKPSSIDCEVLPKLHQVRVAAAEIKGYEIPCHLTYLWRYLHSAYSEPAFIKHCPSDTEILLHWLDSGSAKLSSRQQQLLAASKGKPQTFSFSVPAVATRITIDKERMNMNPTDVKPNINTLPTNVELGDARAGATTPQPLSDFLTQLEDYVPTLPDAVTAAYLNSTGFDGSDPRVVRLISLAAQKFISDIANDALQHCKVRSSSQASKTKGKDRRYALTMEDLTPALAEYGVQVRKPNYFV